MRSEKDENVLGRADWSRGDLDLAAARSVCRPSASVLKTITSTLLTHSRPGVPSVPELRRHAGKVGSGRVLLTVPCLGAQECRSRVATFARPGARRDRVYTRRYIDVQVVAKILRVVCRILRPDSHPLSRAARASDSAEVSALPRATFLHQINDD